MNYSKMLHVLYLSSIIFHMLCSNQVDPIIERYSKVAISVLGILEVIYFLVKTYDSMNVKNKRDIGKQKQ